MRKKNGFSYIEILVALALFSTVLLVALPLTLAVVQNLGAAESRGQKNLAASGMALAVRDSIARNKNVTSSTIIGFANRFGVENYSVYIFLPNGTHARGSPFHSKPLVCNFSMVGFEPFVKGNDSLVVVVLVRSEYGVVVGKSLQLVIDYDRKTGLMRRFYE